MPAQRLTPPFGHPSPSTADSRGFIGERGLAEAVAPEGRGSIAGDRRSRAPGVASAIDPHPGGVAEGSGTPPGCGERTPGTGGAAAPAPGYSPLPLRGKLLLAYEAPQATADGEGWP